MPVRLIHTSDWHLGHELHDVDRAPEHRRFLAWLVERCEQERAHGLLIAGDVFDVSNPPAAALALWAEFLVNLWRRMPGLRVIAIGGNHDSAHRLEMSEPFHAALGRLHVLGAVPRRDGAIDHDRALVRVEGDGDGESVLVAAVPFLRAADLRAADLDDDATAPVKRVLGEILEGARSRRREGEALVAMGHLFVAGGTAGSSERTLVGGIGSVPADVYPADVAYVALGHLHRAQTFQGRVRYSGAPVPLAFDEVKNAAEVVLVTLDGGGLAEARAIAVPQSRALLRVPDDGFGQLPDVLSALGALPAANGMAADERPLLEVRVLLDRPEPSLRQQLDAALDGKAARLVRTQVQYPPEGAPLPDSAAGKAIGELDPVQVFLKRWARKYPSVAPSDEVLAAYGEVLEQARAQVEGGR